jgi:hypothetical protein
VQTVLHHGSRSSVSKRNGLDYVSNQTSLLLNFSPNIINQLSVPFCSQSLGLEQQWFSHYSLQALAKSLVQFIPSKRDENGEDLPSHWRTPSVTFVHSSLSSYDGMPSVALYSSAGFPFGRFAAPRRGYGRATLCFPPVVLREGHSR